MEPPSSIANSEAGSASGARADDPLSRYAGSYLIITRHSDGESDNEFCVCVWSARTGLSYIGRTGNTIS